MMQRDNPLKPLGLANEAALGNQLWQLHSQAELGRKVNVLMLAWLDQVLSREGVSERHCEVMLILAPTLEMQAESVA